MESPRASRPPREEPLTYCKCARAADPGASPRRSTPQALGATSDAGKKYAISLSAFSAESEPWTAFSPTFDP